MKDNWHYLVFVAWAVGAAVVKVAYGVWWMVAWCVGIPGAIFLVANVADAIADRRRRQ